MARGTRRGHPVPPVRSAPSLDAEYQAQLEKIAADVHRDITRADIAELQTAVHTMAASWQRRLERASQRLAEWFSIKASNRSQQVLKRVLRQGGWTVRFRPTPLVQSAINSIVAENVALIKSIPQKYLSDVAVIVQESVEAGRDLKTVSDKLQERYGVTRRRAALIARDQNNKATAMISRIRQQELGISEGIWVHSHAGNEPRPTHVQAGRDKVRFNLAEGWFDPHEGKYILPGQLINCRCTWRPILPGTAE